MNLYCFFSPLKGDKKIFQCQHECACNRKEKKKLVIDIKQLRTILISTD